MSRGPEGLLRVIFAVEDREERSAFSSLMKAGASACEIFFPANIAEVEKLYSEDRADAIVTDFGFHSGALADWLTFWPLPTVLLVDPGDDMGRVEKTTRDESALFVQRMEGLAHIQALPVLIRKSLNIRESTARQNAHLQMTEHQYLNLIQAIPDIVYTLDANGRFLYLNDAIRNLGYEPAALIGRHFTEIVHPDDAARVSRLEALRALGGAVTGEGAAPKLFDERRSGKRMTRNLELRLRPADAQDAYHTGSVTAYGEVSCAGYSLPEFEGQGKGTLGIIRDVTARREHEQALESSLAARETLLREIHHRVKNNLQVVSSLLNIQEGAIEDALARKVFLECQTQIQTMSMVHEVLYRSANLEGVEMQPYFERLVEYLSSVYDAATRRIGCEVAATGVSLSLDDAIPVALMVNELVSNCMKHAFTDGRGGRILVTMKDAADSWLLDVEDDGVGLGRGNLTQGAQSDEAGRGRTRASGIGTELVEALAAQVRGSLEFSAGGEGAGTRASIRFAKA